MSRHHFLTFSNGRPVTILAGWDSRLQRHYAIARYSETDQLPIYDSNVDPNVTRYTSLPTLAVTLASHGVRLPKNMVREMARDAMDNISVREVRYGPAGEILVDKRQCHAA